MFVSWKIVFGKPFSKLSCVCLPLGKVVNGKHFSIKEKFDLVSRKVFFLLIVFVFLESDFRKITFQTFMYLFAVRKVGQRKTLSSQKENLTWFSGKCFPKKFGRKTLFPKL